VGIASDLRLVPLEDLWVPEINALLRVIDMRDPKKIRAMTLQVFRDQTLVEVAQPIAKKEHIVEQKEAQKFVREIRGRGLFDLRGHTGFGEVSPIMFEAIDKTQSHTFGIDPAGADPSGRYAALLRIIYGFWDRYQPN
jgi:hypothetical protein